FSSATTLGMSPRCRSDCATVGGPCGALWGLKCSPALDASGALQSPDSCTWNPCSVPAVSPPSSPLMETPPLLTVNSSSPVAVLPDLLASRATAVAGSAAPVAVSGSAGAPGPSPATRGASLREQATTA